MLHADRLKTGSHELTFHTALAEILLQCSLNNALLCEWSDFKKKHNTISKNGIHL